MKKNCVINLRLTEEQKKELETKAKAEDRTVANYILHNIVGKQKNGTCIWEEDMEFEENNAYHTSCGEMFFLCEGTLKENKMKYCPYCGKRIITRKYNERGEENEINTGTEI